LNDMPIGMTGHLLIPALDPEQCATLSPAVIGYIRGNIGFDGLLLTDDFSMGALSGDMGTRAGQALWAGCDVILHCNGERDEMAALANTVTSLTSDGVRRADAALALRHGPKTPLRDLHDQLKRLEDPIHA
ncbi:MAG: glycoside hydrolase family 3 N-terminal domain-containing protein, partial [Pseudomonadota bacterium]